MEGHLPSLNDSYDARSQNWYERIGDAIVHQCCRYWKPLQRIQFTSKVMNISPTYSCDHIHHNNHKQSHSIIIYVLDNMSIWKKIHLFVGVSDIIYIKKIWFYSWIMKSHSKFGSFTIHGSYFTNVALKTLQCDELKLRGRRSVLPYKGAQN